MPGYENYLKDKYGEEDKDNGQSVSSPSSSTGSKEMEGWELRRRSSS